MTGLATLRALHRAAIPAWGFGADRDEPGRHCRHANCIDAPDPEADGAGLLACLLQHAPQGSRPVLIPAGDGQLRFLSRYRAQLADRFAFALPPNEMAEAMVDKRRQHLLATAHGMPCPTTLFLDGETATSDLLDQVVFPAFLKPVHSHLWRAHFHSKGMLVSGPDDLARALARIAPRGLAVMLQQIITGPATNHYEVCAYMGRDGTPLAVFTTQKIRQWPVDFGIGSLLQSVRMPDLERLTLDFLTAIDYRGAAAIEFKKDARSGAFLMIEVNGRLWSDYILAADCGLNFPAIAYRDLTGAAAQARADYPLGVRWLDGAADAWAAMTMARAGDLRLRDYLTSFAGTRSFAFLDLSDPLPFLAETARFPRRLLTYLSRRRAGGRGN